MMQAATILIIDNDAGYVDSVKQFLELHGYRVIKALNPVSGKEKLEREQPDLAIINAHLLDDTNDKDKSGLTLAREAAPTVPKIILTKFSGWQLVREALGGIHGGSPPAVGFVAKKEGVYKLLTAVKLVLTRFHPLFEQKLLTAFDEKDPSALPQKILGFSPQESIRLFHESAQSAANELAALREREKQEVAHSRRVGWVMRLTGFALVITACFALLANATKPALVSMAVSLLISTIKAFYFRQAERAIKRENRLAEQLHELERAGYALMLCDTLETPEGRDHCRKKVIENLLH